MFGQIFTTHFTLHLIVLGFDVTEPPPPLMDLHIFHRPTPTIKLPPPPAIN